MTAEEWNEEFLKYQQIPEYERVNKGMTLGEFKDIFWWEWGHRQLGRFIGVAFFVPCSFSGCLDGDRITQTAAACFAWAGRFARGRRLVDGCVRSGGSRGCQSISSRHPSDPRIDHILCPVVGSCAGYRTGQKDARMRQRGSSRLVDGAADRLHHSADLSWRSGGWHPCRLDLQHFGR